MSEGKDRILVAGLDLMNKNVFLQIGLNGVVNTASMVPDEAEALGKILADAAERARSLRGDDLQARRRRTSDG